MLKETYPFYVGNRAEKPNTDLEVRDKYSGETATRVALADESTVDRAIGQAAGAVRAMRKLPAYQRQAALRHCVDRFTERYEDLAMALSVEAGKPLQHSRGEVTRLIETFKIAEEESVRMNGEYLPMDRSQRGTGHAGIWRRVPIGACGFITPFNFPLNLAAHKVAPAIAAGCPFVLKPASATPIGALIIGETLAETDLPPGTFSILPCTRESSNLLTDDERLSMLSFTGSADVGWELKARAGRKKVALELGGNAACVVDETADLDDAAARINFGAFYQSGQSCVSVQRILVQESVYDEFVDKLVASAQKLPMGDPKKEDTFIGPIISEKEARRIKGWVDQALEGGARLLCGGGQEGVMMEATLLADASREDRVCSEEIFGPVAVVSSFSDFDSALDQVNDSVYGLQAGVFTRDLPRAYRAWNELDVGGVLINEVPAWRSDMMPYGGVKASGLGREGIRFAMQELTEIRLMVIRGQEQ
jgi:acyl-CoA reductase-like NAD-dependent aldehyde dehydrogenase